MATPQKKLNTPSLSEAFLKQYNVQFSDNDYATREEILLRKSKRILSLADYMDWVEKPRRGAKQSPDMIKLLTHLFYAMDANKGSFKCNLTKHGFKYNRDKFNTRFINNVRNFFNQQVKDFWISCQWTSDVDVEIFIVSHGTQVHAHRKRS